MMDIFYAVALGLPPKPIDIKITNTYNVTTALHIQFLHPV